MRLVVDASVAVLWFVPQQHSDVATLLLSSPHELIAPNVVGPEVANALLKGVRRATVSAADARLALQRVPTAIDLVRSGPLLQDAFELARRHGGSLYDALYLAAGRNNGAAIVTDDTRMLQTAQGAHIPALHVTDPILQQ